MSHESESSQPEKMSRAQPCSTLLGKPALSWHNLCAISRAMCQLVNGALAPCKHICRSHVASFVTVRCRMSVRLPETSGCALANYPPAVDHPRPVDSVEPSCLPRPASDGEGGSGVSHRAAITARLTSRPLRLSGAVSRAGPSASEYGTVQGCARLMGRESNLTRL